MITDTIASTREPRTRIPATDDAGTGGGNLLELQAGLIPQAAELLPFIPPILQRKASGLYVLAPIIIGPHLPGAEEDADAAPIPIIPLPIGVREELRLDVDGRYPQMAASGILRTGLTGRTHWVAKLSKVGTSWEGPIFYKQVISGPPFPYASVKITTSFALLPSLQYATAVFSAPGVPSVARRYKYSSPYFHSVEFEFDCAGGTTGVTAI